MNERRRGLGRGLGALIPPAPALSAGRPGGRPVDVFFAGGSVAVAEPEAERHVAPADAAARLDAALRARPSTATDDPGVEQAPAARQAETEHEARTAEENTETPVDAVVTPTQDEHATAESDELLGVPGASFREIPLDSIRANARQPRQVFDEEDLNELVASIGEVGVLQPIVVREVEDGYELVMGERRWRACRLAGLTMVPAIVRETADSEMLRDALLENLHRSQLNPLEEAAAYDQLLKDFGCSHEQLASRLGRSRPQISNMIRLLNLPSIVQRRVAAGVLSAGHARALLGLSDAAKMERLAQRIVAEGLSVRTTEEIVALGGDEDEPNPRRRRHASEPNERLDSIAANLGDRLETRVKIAMGARRGRLTVEFAGMDDLERILSVLTPAEN